MLAPIFPSPTIPSFIITEVGSKARGSPTGSVNHELPTKSRTKLLIAARERQDGSGSELLSRFAAHVK